MTIHRMRSRRVVKRLRVGLGIVSRMKMLAERNGGYNGTMVQALLNKPRLMWRLGSLNHRKSAELPGYLEPIRDSVPAARRPMFCQCLAMISAAIRIVPTLT